MENEDNRNLIHKKASKDQWASLVSVEFGQFSFGALSLFSLSCTLGHFFLGAPLKECGILGFLEQEGKGIAGKHKRALREAPTLDFIAGIMLHVCFLH